MSTSKDLGGIIHTYQKYDPLHFPSPTTPPPDLISPAFEHMLMHGDMREFTPEELAKMVKIDPSQIGGLMPNLDYLKNKLLERKRKILATYETEHVQKQAANEYQAKARSVQPPNKLTKEYNAAVASEQLFELESLYYRAQSDQSPFARGLVQLVQRLADKYQIDDLAAKYEFTGQQKMDVPEALEIKEELETIDKLLKQLEDAKQNAQLGYIEMDELQDYLDAEGMEKLREIQQMLEDYVREQAKQQGLESDSRNRFQMTPKAFRVFQSRVLSQIFEELKASRTGRHQNGVEGEGATETPRTKEYEFGDSITHMDIPGTLINAMVRTGNQRPLRLRSEDILIHRTRNTPKAATCVLLDMSGSMRYDGQYVNVKRMGLALDGLIRSEYPGDFLQFIEMYTFAKSRPIAEIPGLMPKPVTIHSPVVRIKVDMSNPKLSEYDVPSHFTNIQHALQLARQHLSVQSTPNRNIMLITDGLPTAHYEGNTLFLIYPPNARTEDATMREAMLCAREGITINIFLISTWNQSEEDIRFARKLAETTKGRVIFTAGRELDRYVIWDYIKRRKSIVG